jgi:Peptidase inhibitor I78 family
MIFRWMGAASAMTLTACQPQGSAPDIAPPQADSCGAERVANWTRKADTAAARSTIAAASGARIIRWITPGMPVTMDYRTDRLDVRIDAAARYIDFNCG